jgi:Heparinase II/III-like protein
MRNRLLLSIFAAILLLGSFTLSAQIVVPPDKIELPSHPRILMLKGEEAAILKTVANDATWKNMHSEIIKECDNLLTRPPVERVLIGKRLLDKSREALRRIFYLSYAWRTTNDVKYFNRAEKEMLAVSAFSDWHPEHFLDVAEMTMAVSIGYDWLYNSLSAGSKELIKNAIIEKGLKPSLDPKNNSWLKVTHNWNQVCNTGMTYGALAVYEDQPALSVQIINRAAVSINLPMDDCMPDGAYPEGYSYWGYGTTFNVMFISALEKVFGKTFDFSGKTGFFKTAGFLENMTGPSGSCFNFSDSGERGEIHPAMFWFASRLNDPSLLWSEKKYLIGEHRANDRLLPAIMIWSAGLKIDKIAAPSKTMWVGTGKNPVSLMRTSWSDPNAIYVAMKGGSPDVNHAHMDAGSFIMEADGVRWAMDFGSQDYNSLESKGVDLWNMKQNSQRWEVFRYNNFAHNTLTIDGKLQQVSGYALIKSFSANPLMMNAIIDLTSIYADQIKSAFRGIAIVDKHYVTIRDELETLANETIIRWTMVTSADVKITGNNTAELTKDGKRLILKVMEPAKIKMKTWTTVPPHIYDAQNPGTIMVGFETTIQANTKTAIQVFLLPGGTTSDAVTIPGALNKWPE